MRVYLVIIDETEEAARALRFAFRRAMKTGGAVHILALVPRETFNAFGTGLGLARGLQSAPFEHQEGLDRDGLHDHDRMAHGRQRSEMREPYREAGENPGEVAGDDQRQQAARRAGSLVDEQHC